MTHVAKFQKRNGSGRNIAGRDLRWQEGYRCAMRDAVTLLHVRAKGMKHGRAEDVLNSAANELGWVAKGGKAQVGNRPNYTSATARHQQLAEADARQRMENIASQLLERDGANYLIVNGIDTEHGNAQCYYIDTPDVVYYCHIGTTPLDNVSGAALHPKAGRFMPFEAWAALEDEKAVDTITPLV